MDEFLSRMLSMDDPLFSQACEWTRRNGEVTEGTVIGREGNCLIINAPFARAVPFKVPEDKVTIIPPERQQQP